MFEQCVTELDAAGNHVDALDSTVVLAGMWVTAGRPSRARALCEQALRSAKANGEPYPRATADLHTWLAELALGANDLPVADDHLAISATLAERSSITENQHRWPAVKAGVCAARGEYNLALDLLDDAADRYRAGFYPDLHPLPATRARVQLASGNLDEAVRWASRRGISLDDHLQFSREYEHLTLVRTHLALAINASFEGGRANALTGEPTRADLPAVLELLARLETAAATTGRHGSVLEVRLLRALAEHASENPAAAAATLVHALTQAPEVDGYTRLFLAERSALEALVDAASASSRAETAASLASWWQQLIAGTSVAADPAAAAEPQALSTASNAPRLPDSLSEREIEVLRLLATELSGPEIARGLYITVNTLRTHTKRIFTKLNVSSRAAAVRRARELEVL